MVRRGFWEEGGNGVGEVVEREDRGFRPSFFWEMCLYIGISFRWV